MIIGRMRWNMRLLVATHNQKKLKEIKELLSHTEIEVISLKDVDFDFEIEENKDTFIGNAVVKAKTIQSFYPNDMILSDDSGFCVHALENKPGVHSSRFLGTNTPDHIKNNEILNLIKNSPDRKAMFVCAMVLLYKKDEFITQQCVYGHIPEKAQGYEDSFGYDPIFIPDGHESTFAMDLETKSKISHRAKALKEVMEYVHYLTK